MDMLFALDMAKLGFGGVIGWVAVLVLVFVILGYVIYVLDHLKKTKRQK